MKNQLLMLLCFLTIPHAIADFDMHDLKILVEQSELKDSDVFIVWKDGVLLHSKNPDSAKKYSIQSVTKSLTAMTAVCILKDQPEKLDLPLVFKEWEGTAKAGITLRMLLSMTSGIIDPADPWGEHDYYQHAADQPLTFLPGEKFVYANTSPMMIGKWIKESTGQQFSYHIKKCMFDALKISDWTIGKDGKKNEVVAGGIKILAQDLLKVGIMLAQGGNYQGKQLFSPSQITELRKDPLKDGHSYSLGFWLWGRDIYYMEGYLGQFLIMVPSQKLVVLRLRNRALMQDSPENNLNSFTELPGLINQLIK
ncbi:MAG TPA: serine hydrolase [Bacteriovoracaceae bacterium]|nr:serine hydrolase [Bacteriovoracaceae bacterium]